MELRVTKSKGSLVQPNEATPWGMLDLSRIDRLPALRCNARTLHVFDAVGPRGTAHSIIREALSKALVPYYPLAGRLKENGSDLMIECTGEGVWFVESFANCSLKSVGYFEDVMSISIPFDHLLPHDHDHGIDPPLILIQVTEFEGDGFVIGLTFCHAICDGLGSAQFLNALGEFARCIPLTVAPVWHRNFLPHPQNSSCPPPPPSLMVPEHQLEQVNVDIPLHRINELKHTFQGNCSSFEIVAAFLWKNRTQVISLGGGSSCKLVFFANCRHLVDPPLPNGFYGNCFFPVTITASSDTLAQASIADVVKMIQEAKARLPKEFSDWVSEEAKEDPFAPPLGYTTLFMSEWGRLGFNQVDYGSGPPRHIAPLQGSSIIPVAIVATLPRPNTGIRLMTWCVHTNHLQPFRQAITTNSSH